MEEVGEIEFKVIKVSHTLDRKSSDPIADRHCLELQSTLLLGEFLRYDRLELMLVLELVLPAGGGGEDGSETRGSSLRSGALVWASSSSRRDHDINSCIASGQGGRGSREARWSDPGRAGLLMVARMISTRDRPLQGPSEHGFSHSNRAKQYYWRDSMYIKSDQFVPLRIFLQLMRTSWG